MKKNVQKTLTGEVIDRLSRANPISLPDIVLLLLKYLLSKANLQRMLFIVSFLTYGVGDGVTAAYMMDKMGAMHEINPVARFMYLSFGAQGVIIIKTWFALLILFLVWVISRKTNTYWTINGFLSALCVGGIMVMGANMIAAYGMPPPSANSIITTFLFLTVLFVILGDMMDKLHGTAGIKRHGIRMASPVS